MAKNYLVGVTDGSAWCRYTVIPFENDQEAEAFLTEGYAQDGARPFWVAAQQKVSLYSFQRLCRVAPFHTGYLLDVSHWTKYFHDGEKFIWEDLSEGDY